MSLEYAERLAINGRTYGITAEHDCWVGGCRIYTGKDRADARAQLHAYALREANAQVLSATKALETGKGLLNRLGDDPFNLGRFRV